MRYDAIRYDVRQDTRRRRISPSFADPERYLKPQNFIAFVSSYIFLNESCTRTGKRSMIDISIYCQPTPWNDRLLSLLSAVLLNPIRPDFTRAINDKPSVLPAHRPTQDVVGVVILLPPVGESKSRVWEACKRLRRRIERFAIRYSMHVTFVNCDQTIKENFVQTLK